MATAVLLTVALACGTTQAGDPSAAQVGWVAQATAWISGYDAAFDAGTGEHALYLAADVVMDTTVLGEERHAEGRQRTLALQRQVYDGPVQRADLFLGQSDVVRTESWSGSGGTHQVLAWIVVGDDGISRYRHAVPEADAPGGDTDLLGRLVGAYARAWQGDAGTVRDLYSEQARLTDGIRGVHLVGRSAISTRADAEPIEGRPESSPASGPVYVHGGDGQSALQVWLLWPAAGPCGSDMTTALDLDSDRVVHERRYYSAAGLATCRRVREPDDGWWVGRDQPVQLGERLTAVVAGPSGPVQIRNGGPVYTQVVAWALDRFAAAGLPAPDVAVVAFDPLDRDCAGRCGLAMSTPPATALVCVDAAGLNQSAAPSGQPLPLWPSRVVLHELTHIWLDQHTDPSARQRLVDVLGLTVWDDPEAPWSQQGVEWAAESMVWGLVGRPLTLSALGSPPCDLMAQAFRTVSGAEPLTGCP